MADFAIEQGTTQALTWELDGSVDLSKATAQFQVRRHLGGPLIFNRQMLVIPSKRLIQVVWKPEDTVGMDIGLWGPSRTFEDKDGFVSGPSGVWGIEVTVGEDIYRVATGVCVLSREVVQ